MQSDIERVEVDNGNWDRNQETKGVERGQTAVAAGGDDRKPERRRVDTRDSFVSGMGSGLSLMRGWGASQQARVNPTDDESTAAGNMSVDLDRPTTPPTHEEEVQVRLPPPSLFFDALGGQLRHADRVDAAKQGTWRFFLLFLYSILLTIFSIYCVSITLQYLYGIYITDPTAEFRVLNVGHAEFNKDRLKVTSSQMVPFSVQSTHPDALRFLLAGADTSTKGIYMGTQVGNDFQYSVSIVSDLTGDTSINSLNTLSLNPANNLVSLADSKLSLGCSKINGDCIAVNGSVLLGSSSKHKTTVKGDLAISGLMTTKNVKIVGR